MPNMKITQCT